jgi:hypothetical protein
MVTFEKQTSETCEINLVILFNFCLYCDIEIILSCFLLNKKYSNVYFRNNHIRHSKNKLLLLQVRISKYAPPIFEGSGHR